MNTLGDSLRVRRLFGLMNRRDLNDYLRCLVAVVGMPAQCLRNVVGSPSQAKLLNFAPWTENLFGYKRSYHARPRCYSCLTLISKFPLCACSRPMTLRHSGHNCMCRHGSTVLSDKAPPCTFGMLPVCVVYSRRKRWSIIHVFRSHNGCGPSHCQPFITQYPVSAYLTA
jgi:hypothetical protein